MCQSIKLLGKLSPFPRIDKLSPEYFFELTQSELLHISHVSYCLIPIQGNSNKELLCNFGMVFYQYIQGVKLFLDGSKPIFSYH